jgi:nitroimidazol reductase NimA-like FMN-containing flavoprotein (pyridoxamine 5'-phosphate oxidase superfamily)
MMTELDRSERTTLKRMPDRGHFDRATINSIVDEAMICHVGVVDDQGRPAVIPTFHARDGDDLLIHGSAASKLLRTARNTEICVTITLIDSLVLARTALHHSANYRSVVIFGVPEQITDDDEADAALSTLVNGLVPGRMDEVRPNTTKEVRSTMVLRLPITEASAKIRNGPPVDDDEDMLAPVWAGLIPISTTFGEPVTAADMRVDVPVAKSAQGYARPT